MLEIDGSLGEGGGQILRTALSLSTLLKKPFRVFNIRRGRKRPGLMPQHLMCVHALKLISGADVEGDSKGSPELIFRPGDVRAGDYSFDIGTAGSTTLLLQAILPPLILAGGRSSVILEGGTHVPFSPTFDYIKNVFLPVLDSAGISIRAEIDSYGFYPRGGGKIRVDISPLVRLKGLNLHRRAGVVSVRGVSAVGNLPFSIAERQAGAAVRILEMEGISAEIEVVSVPTPGQGTFVFLDARAGDCIAGFSSLGERGKRAETVGEEAAKGLLDYLRTDACLGPHLSDQIVLYLSMAGEASSFKTSCITRHLITNLEVLQMFLDIRYSIEGEEGFPGRVEIENRSI